MDSQIDPDEMSHLELHQRFDAIVRADTVLWPALLIARDLDLPDWLIASGAVYQSVWNALTGHPCGYGLRDIDLIYFDGGDLSWDAEDIQIRRAEAAFTSAGIPVPVEPRNQARVHLWFEDKYGIAYPPLSCAADSLARYESTASAIGIQIDTADTIHVSAPFGIDDAMAMRFRHNVRTVGDVYDRKAARCRKFWPQTEFVK